MGLEECLVRQPDGVVVNALARRKTPGFEYQPGFFIALESWILIF